MLQAERLTAHSEPIIILAMKKFFLLTMTSLIICSGISSATELRSCIPSPPGFWIKFDFSFHRPKKNCESGFGVCLDVTYGIDGSVGKVDQNLCPVRGQLNERNQLVVEVTEDALTKYERGSTLPYFKGKTSITISDPYTLSPGTCRALGAGAPLTIKPGIYPVIFEKGTYTVTFQL